MIFIFNKKRKSRENRFLKIFGTNKQIVVCILFFTFNTAAVLAAVSSNNILKGKVVDSNGQAIPGANVVIDGTLTGVSTLNDGTFQFMTTLESGYLKITSVGFKEQRVAFKINEELIIRMEDEISELDEVRVIAYGTQSRRESVGAISSIKADDIKDIPSPSLTNLLQGKIAGMNVVNISGAPGGAGTAVTIRGFNSLSSEHGRRLSNPKYILDGVPLQSNMSEETGLDLLAEIDPNDIEDIQVLKDASSASIYGSEAANGVIIITTKKGRYNQKAKLSVGFTQTLTFKPSFNDITGGNRERQHRLEAIGNYQSTYYDAQTNSYKYADSHYDALKSVTNLVKDARKVQKTVLMVAEISDIYVTNFSAMLKDENYTSHELSAIAEGYSLLLAESNDLLTELTQIISKGFSMNDSERLLIIDNVYVRVRDYRDLVSYYTRKTLSVSLIRSKEKGATARFYNLYGTNKEKYW